MNRFLSIYLILFVAWMTPNVVCHAEDAGLKLRPDKVGYQKIIQPFFRQHCIACHGTENAEADLSVIDNLPNEFLDLDNKARWSEVVNVLNSHEMPPEDETQPEPAKVAEVVDWITNQIVKAEQVSRSSRITLRRLNRNEYQNTIRDLLGIEYRPDKFPQDPSSGGFDNNGNALSLSPLHLELYYDAAREILDRALVDGEPPEKIKWRFEHEEANGDWNLKQYGEQKIIVHGGLCRKEAGFTVMRRDQWDLRPTAREFYIKEPGEYAIRIRVGGKVPTREEVINSATQFYAQRRDQDLAQSPDAYEWAQAEFEKNIEHFKSDSIYNYGSPRLRLMLNMGGQPVKLAEWDIEASVEAPQIYTLVTTLEAKKSGISLEYAYDIPQLPENDWFQIDANFARPEVWVDWSEIEGPIYETWPPTSHQRIIPQAIPSDALERRELAREVINNFAAAAFRRPVTKSEVEKKLAIYDRAIKETDSFIVAIKSPLTAILVSPNFLFINEPSTDTGRLRKLNDYEVASRLSYFLWSNQPDQELYNLAGKNELTEKSKLAAQVDRLLADKKSQQFTRNFAAQWLGLREVGANPPTPDFYPRYDRHLELSIVDESLRFFHEILENDLSCENFIRSDFVVINERLARYYGIPDVQGDHFRVVKVPPDVHRGGVMTQASMLTITSNGTRTSPVKRGTWILKNVLGMDPGLPVANAGEIAPKVPGIDKATVRKRLEAHRELPQCARCHNKIDPLGFALENFDASGRWRQKEGFGQNGRIQKDDPEINASSRLPDGTEVVGVDGLCNAMMARKDLFYKCLAEKVFTYALGRELGVADQPTIAAAVSHMKENDESLRSLIKFVVTSNEFLTK